VPSTVLTGAQRRPRSGPVDVLTSDLAVYILGMLDDEVLVQCMGVCRKWQKLGEAPEIWSRRSERCKDGVNWHTFQRLGVLRQKAHSMVVQCRSRKSGKYLVVKRISTRINPSTGEAQDIVQDQGFPVRYLREVSLLKASAHQNVMRLHFVCHQEGSLDIFSEFVGQNLEDYIAGLPNQSFVYGTDDHTWAMSNCKSFLKQILGAVCYCHSRGILMRDIKPRNVMLDNTGSGTVKLTGFALGRFASLPTEPLTREVVTLSYRPPEILLGGQNPAYSSPVDMWSVGCTLAEIASGMTLFEGESEIGLLFCIFRSMNFPATHLALVQVFLRFSTVCAQVVCACTYIFALAFISPSADVSFPSRSALAPPQAPGHPQRDHMARCRPLARLSAAAAPVEAKRPVGGCPAGRHGTRPARLHAPLRSRAAHLGKAGSVPPIHHGCFHIPVVGKCERGSGFRREGSRRWRSEGLLCGGGTQSRDGAG
jgi:serine/threonine protein kinase